MSDLSGSASYDVTPASTSGAAPGYRFFAAYAQSRIAVAALGLVFAVMLVAIFAPYLTPQDPYDLRQLNIADSKLPPGETSMQDGYVYLLGTDDQGRDLYSGIIYGLRISLSVGIVSTVAALAIGMAIGLVAAYFGGWVDTLIMRIVDIQLSFPAILIALILLAILGKGVDKVVLALIMVQWAYYARTVRGAALVERSKEYIEATHCLALSHPRIIFRHLLPNCLPPMLVVGTMQMAHAVTLEATLSFLGVGVPVTEPSLGLLISNGFEYMLSGMYWISFYPGVALFVIVASVNLIGDQLRDVLNPRLER